MTPSKVSVLLLAICAVAGWQVSVIPESAIQMAVGPDLVPAVVVLLMSLVSVFYAYSAFQGKQRDEASEEDHSALPGSQLRMATLLLGGVIFIVLVPIAGFVIPATLCGMCIARSFDAPLNMRSALICGSVALGFWVLFAKILLIGLGPASPFGL